MEVTCTALSPRDGKSMQHTPDLEEGTGIVENIQEDEEKDDEGHEEEEEKKKSNYANAHSRLNSHVCLVYFLVP